MVSGEQVGNERESAQNEHRCGRKRLGSRVTKFGVGANSENEIGNEPEGSKNTDCAECESDEEAQGSENFEESKRSHEIGAMTQAINKIENFLGHGEVIGATRQHHERGNDGEEDSSTTHGRRRYSSTLEISGMPGPICGSGALASGHD